MAPPENPIHVGMNKCLNGPISPRTPNPAFRPLKRRRTFSFFPLFDSTPPSVTYDNYGAPLTERPYKAPRRRKSLFDLFSRRSGHNTPHDRTEALQGAADAQSPNQGPLPETTSEEQNQATSKPRRRSSVLARVKEYFTSGRQRKDSKGPDEEEVHNYIWDPSMEPLASLGMMRFQNLSGNSVNAGPSNFYMNERYKDRSCCIQTKSPWDQRCQQELPDWPVEPPNRPTPAKNDDVGPNINAPNRPPIQNPNPVHKSTSIRNFSISHLPKFSRSKNAKGKQRAISPDPIPAAGAGAADSTSNPRRLNMFQNPFDNNAAPLPIPRLSLTHLGVLPNIDAEPALDESSSIPHATFTSLGSSSTRPESPSPLLPTTASNLSLASGASSSHALIPRFAAQSNLAASSQHVPAGTLQSSVIPPTSAAASAAHHSRPRSGHHHQHKHQHLSLPNSGASSCHCCSYPTTIADADAGADEHEHYLLDLTLHRYPGACAGYCSSELSLLDGLGDGDGDGDRQQSEADTPRPSCETGCCGRRGRSLVRWCDRDGGEAMDVDRH
ncbi:hypothetical protein BS50DRAFT_294670 [Corynespora cassiicola Philippines]|uniref:Uncharacterized protein n=1 Tax=Corynespora cassiicola Philippines TaxID=1448308 RepID=A0A2T2NW93_CORCC|nr:hypothetical protein BS50DRAFT_294670 [Corynespora cassiicola Philippines]